MNRKTLFTAMACVLTFSAIAQLDSSLFNCMRWRMVGPFRGGRTVGACGIKGRPNVFYMGVNNGGVWKTDDFGRTWQPLFDEQPTGSIGDVQVAPSNPNVIYAGSGEGLQRPDLSTGDGIYKSTDGGKTWLNTGIKDGLQIGRLAIDPKNENRVFAAVLGHPYGPNSERGVYRTLDGGKTWEKIFFIDENTGAIQVEIDPANSDIIFADMWQARQGPWENGSWQGPNSGLYKSIDGGKTWKKLSAGLPTAEQGLGRIGFCIAPGNNNRMYATVEGDETNGGLYRSDDAGESWKKMSGDTRLWGRGDDFAEVKADPKNEDIVYDADVVVWKSTDGGKTWNGFKGAPGGDDYHRLWINPDNPQIILLAGDQGAAVTVNGGETWSSWYNQPTAQLYHVSADNAFPYNLYSGQQESGSVGIASRGNDGEITFRDWHPVAAEEYGYVVADPLDPNIVYGGKLSRYDKRTGQAQDISPEAVKSGKYRFLRTAPLLFSPTNPRCLYYAGNVLFKSYDGGNSWKVISPDLTRATWDVPVNVGVYKTEQMKTMPRRGVIYTIAPSPLDSNTIWIGTDDGLIQVTHDGGNTWKDVTPPAVTSWSKVSIIDASHTDINTAYAAVNRIRLDDYTPHIYRTTDGGKTWKEIIKGIIPAPVNVVRKDPLRKGLLFAGSERNVSVSFDDGENWQSLRLNMPATSIRDLIIKDNDIAVATHGRSFWILDDIAPLRQINSGSQNQPAILYKPAPAYRVRWNMNPDTPLPPDEPAGENPPDGAIIDYYLNGPANSEVALDITDLAGHLVRHYSSNDTLYKIPDVNIPLYWIRPQQILSGAKGSHRFLWDMRYAPLNVPADYPISAVYKNTEPNPTAPYVMPGIYTIQLKVNGKVYSQTIEIKMDPRVKTPFPALQQQHDISLLCYQERMVVLKAISQVKTAQEQIKTNYPKATKELKEELTALGKKLSLIDTGHQEISKQNLQKLSSSLESVFNILQGADAAPTSQTLEAAQSVQRNFAELMKQFEPVENEIKTLNMKLKKAKLPLLVAG